MNLSKDEFIKVNEILQYIIDYDVFFDDESMREEIISDDEISEHIVNNKGRSDIYLYFPGEEDVEIPAIELIKLEDDIKSINIEDNSHIKTKNRSIYIVSANDQYKDYILEQYENISLEYSDEIKINLISSSVIIGLAATKLREYDQRNWPTYSAYNAIEVIYLNEASKLSDREEIKLIDSFIFEVADSTDIALIRSEIHCPLDDFTEIEVENIADLRQLHQYNEGMKYFSSAVQIEDPGLKFLGYYKVLEHFSPVALSVDAHELMRKKLDISKSNFDSGDFIKSIFDLSKSVQSRKSDEELIKSSFIKCIDFVGLFGKLPNKIQANIKKHLKVGNVDYSLDPQKVMVASNMVAKIIYKTRNHVVHAKSNFENSGDELTSDDELINMNEFMKEASSQAVRWYSRLPDHHKIGSI